jgi:hypothetical protein
MSKEYEQIREKVAKQYKEQIKDLTNKNKTLSNKNKSLIKEIESLKKEIELQEKLIQQLMEYKDLSKEDIDKLLVISESKQQTLELFKIFEKFGGNF